MGTSPVVAAFDEECRRFGTTLLKIDRVHFRRPTRCAPWDLRALVAHVHVGVSRLLNMLSVSVSDEPHPDPLVYYRARDVFDRARDRARQAAVRDRLAGFATPQQLVLDFLSVSRRAVEHAAAEPADRPVRTHWGPVMRLEDYLRTRVVEVGVHGLDGADALDREPWLGSAAATVIQHVLVELLGQNPPSELGWDDLDLILVGTGRRAITPEENRALGVLAARFPLLR
jgi:uncharacterized protein (TIGR03083 family)